MAWISVFVVLILMTNRIQVTRTAILYDILNLIYQLCSTDSSLRDQRLECVDFYLQSKITSKIETCVWSNKTLNKGSVNHLCSNMTNVTQWSLKYQHPPKELTKVISLSAFAKMACVLKDAQLPILRWQKAFEKCFHPWQEKLTKKQRSKSKTSKLIETAF